MARLIIQALSEDTIAAPGNSQPNYIVASVTSTNGQGVTGLTAANFKVTPMIVGPGGALVNIVNVYGSTFPGFYHIHVRPITPHTWKAGVYVFAIVVQKGINHGQTLAAVMMD